MSAAQLDPFFLTYRVRIFVYISKKCAGGVCGDEIEIDSITTTNPSKVPTVSPIIANVAGQTIVYTSQSNSPSIETTSSGAQIELKSKGKYLGMLCLVINLLI